MAEQETEPGSAPATRRLVLAPHFDDAVMSCWRAVAGDDAVHVTVATVFAGPPTAGCALGEWDRAAGATDPDSAWRERVAEDTRALTRTGASAVHLPFVDAQYQVGPPPRAAIREAISELVRSADEVWIPAGVGAHPDHLMVSEIGLDASAGKRRFVFADLPYAAGSGWTALVEAARRGGHGSASLDAQHHFSCTIPALSLPVAIELSDEEQAAKRRAVMEYRSQLDPLSAAFGAWYDAPVTARFELRWSVGPDQSAQGLLREHELLAEVFRQASDDEKERDRMRQEHHRATSEIQLAHERELAALREQHSADVAAAIEQTTRMFHESTSWRLSAPVRSLGRLRMRLAERRSRATQAAAAETRAVEQATSTEEQPSAGAALKPPPNPGVQTWPADQFNELYQQHADPWGYSSRWYEQRKYGITLACLPDRRYRRAFEPGCSVGVLSELLAARTDSMISADFAAPALIHARERLARFPQVDVRLIAVPTEWPEGSFDLIVISEMATYLSDDDLTLLVERTTGSLEPEGSLVLVHYRPNTGTPHNAAEVHDRFRQHPQLTQVAAHQEDEFLLDVFQRTT